MPLKSAYVDVTDRKPGFTEGEWSSITPPSSSLTTREIVGPNGEPIAQIGSVGFSLPNIKEEVANAKLIALSPEMFATCKAVLEMHDELFIKLLGHSAYDHNGNQLDMSKINDAYDKAYTVLHKFYK